MPLRAEPPATDGFEKNAPATRGRCRRCGKAMQGLRPTSPAEKLIDVVRQRRLARRLPTYARRVRELAVHCCEPTERG
jgi:hypothetical protein